MAVINRIMDTFELKNNCRPIKQDITRWSFIALLWLVDENLP